MLCEESALTRGGDGKGDLVWFVLASNQIRPDGEIELDERRDCDRVSHVLLGQSLCPVLGVWAQAVAEQGEAGGGCDVGDSTGRERHVGACSSVFCGCLASPRHFPEVS